MRCFGTCVSVLLVAGMLVSCGGGGGDDSASGASSPHTTSGGTPDTTTAGTPGTTTTAGTPESTTTAGTPGTTTSGGTPSGGTPDTTAGGTPDTTTGGTPGTTTGGGTPGTTTGGSTGTLPSAGAHVEESHAAVTLTGVWTQSDSRYGWSGGAARQSTAAGATASFSFTGSSVRWIGSRGAFSGIALVRVDGGPAIEVDLYAKPFEIRTPVLTLYDLGEGPHTLTIEVTGRQNPNALSNAVVVDAFDVQPPIVSHLQETDPDVTFSAGWTKAPDTFVWSGCCVRTVPDPAIGGARVTETAGETVTLKFRGTSISWIGYRGPDAGIARVQVNGGAVTEVDLFSPKAKVQELVFTATGLADTKEKHTLTIEATGRKNDASTAAKVVVDAFDVTTPGRRYQETNAKEQAPKIIFTGAWNDDNVNRVWSEGAAATTSEKGARVAFSFTGTSVSWIGCEKSSIGRANIYIDGAFKVRVNMNKPVPIEGYQRTIYRADDLTDGPHVLEIEAVGDGFVVVDAFDVHP